MLDPYQALTHLKVASIWRDKNAPLIDYLTTKLVYLTMLLDDARDKELDEYQAASTAFVSFKDARTARLALRILDNHPKRSLACHTLPAPDWTDLLWPRLGRSVYKSELIRSWVTFIGVWAFTLAWVCSPVYAELITDLSRWALLFPNLPIKYWRIPASSAQMAGSESKLCYNNHISRARHLGRFAHYRYMSDSASGRQ